MRGTRAIDALAVALDLGQHVRVANRTRLNQIDAAAEQFFNLFLEPEETVQISRRFGGELNQKISIAIGTKVGCPSRRAEHLGSYQTAWGIEAAISGRFEALKPLE